MPTNELASLLRSKFEENGQAQRFRAMMMEAGVKVLQEKAGERGEVLFSSSTSIREKALSSEGSTALGLVFDFLRCNGLHYTSSVLAMEIGVPQDNLFAAADLRKRFNVASKDDSVLEAAISSKGAAASRRPSALENRPKSEGKENKFEISNWNRKHFVRHGQISGQQLQIEYLEECTVLVLDPLDSLTADDCIGGELLVAAVEGSVFLRNCRNMKVTVACKQLRTRDSSDLDLRLFSATDPVIESSHGILVKPFNVELPDLKLAFQKARLDPAANRFVHVYDFTPDDSGLSRRHFTVLPYPDHELQMEPRAHALGVPESPSEIRLLLEGKLQPAASSEKGGSFDIRAGPAAWTGASNAAHRRSSSGLATAAAPPAQSTAAIAPPARSLSESDYSSFDDSDSASGGMPANEPEDDDEF